MSATKIARKTPWLLLPLLFLAAYALILPRAPRFEDENYALINGRNIIHALKSSDVAFKKEAAEFDAIMGIGPVVTLPVGGVFAATRNLIAARWVLALFALTYWFSLILCFQSFCVRFAPTVKWSPLEFTLMALTMLCLVQGIPGSYLSQSLALGEYPGAAFCALAFALLFRGRVDAAIIAMSLSVCAKVHFLAYVPLLLFTAHRSRYRTLLLFLLVPLTIQLLKLAAFGWPAYSAALSSYADFFFHKSGSGLGAHNPQFTAAVDEWPHYSWREKAYYLLGTFSPVAVVAYYGMKRRKDEAVAFMAALTFFILLGSFHWWYISVVKWWRWSHYFVIPGYSLGIFAAVLETWRLSRGRGGKTALAAAPWLLLAVASYVQVRQTIIGTWQNSKPLTAVQRTFIDWKTPGRVGP